MWPRDEVHAILHFDSGINMDAGIAGKRKHLDLDEDTTNRKVNFFLSYHERSFLVCGIELPLVVPYKQREKMIKYCICRSYVLRCASL